ncbi:hypothetical protein Dimus_015299 [Dionaea muscipula]
MEGEVSSGGEQPTNTDLIKEMINTMRELAEATRIGAQPREPEPRATSAMREFQRLHPPEFNGEADPLIAEEWLEQITQMFDTLRIHEEDLRVSFAAYQLRGDARYWWRIASATVGDSWENFKNTFLDKYLPESTRDNLREEFEHLIQGSMTVDQYAAKFTSLARFAEDLVSTEERRCKRFEAGLRPGIRDRLAALRLRIFSDLLESARAVERTLAANQKIKEGSSRLRTSGATSDSRPTKKQRSSSTGSFPIQTNPSRPTQSFSASSRGVSGQSGRGGIICYQCHQPGHRASECTQQQSFSQRPLALGQQSEVPIICFQCGQASHTRRSCPSRFGAQDGAVSLPAQSSQSAPTLQALRPAQLTHSAHSAHSAHSVQVSGTGTRRAPANDTLRGGPSTQLTQGRVYAIGGVSVPEVIADEETPGTTADASVARG